MIGRRQDSIITGSRRLLAFAWVASARTQREFTDVLDHSTTTAFAFGVWNSHLTPIPTTYSANVDCAHNANDRFVPPTPVLAGRTVSPAAYLWFGSRGIAGPWFGWDTCSISVLISAPLDNDDSMIAWLVSHE